MHLHYDDGQSVLSLNYPGWLAHIGISSNGLASTGNSLYATPPAEDTVPFSLLKRLILEKKTVPEVLAATAPLRFENACLLIGSSNGEGVCIEYVAGRRSLRDISQQEFGHANSILDPKLQIFEVAPKHETGDMASSSYRQKNIQRLLEEEHGNLDAEVLQRIVADHGDYPHSICRHGATGQSQTTSAFIADLTDRKVHLCIGNPCVAPFREYSL
jgi:isopenicillin-N N-acyltransferase-like protein